MRITNQMTINAPNQCDQQSVGTPNASKDSSSDSPSQGAEPATNRLPIFGASHSPTTESLDEIA